MVSTTDIIDNYLGRIQAAATDKEKKRITDNLLLYYYHLSTDQQRNVDTQMRSVIAQLGRDLAKTDPLIQQAHKLLGI